MPVCLGTVLTGPFNKRTEQNRFEWPSYNARGGEWEAHCHLSGQRDVRSHTLRFFAGRESHEGADSMLPVFRVRYCGETHPPRFNASCSFSSDRLSRTSRSQGTWSPTF